MSTGASLMTDSGGIQEEATAPNIRKKCFVLRTSTERQEAVDAGFAELVGVNPKRVKGAIQEWWAAGARVSNKKSPFGDGKASQRVVKIMEKAGYWG